MIKQPFLLSWYTCNRPTYTPLGSTDDLMDGGRSGWGASEKRRRDGNVSVQLSVCKSACLSAYMFVSGSSLVSVCLCVIVLVAVCVCFCLSICLSVYLSVCLYVWLSIYLSAFLYVCLSVCLSLCLYVCEELPLPLTRIQRHKRVPPGQWALFNPDCVG